VALSYDDIPHEFNLTSWFLDRNVDEGRGDRVALYCGDDAHNYGALAERTNRIGNVLLGLGVRPQERVLLALTDGLDFVAAWFAVLKIGAVVAEVYTFLQPQDYAYYVDYSRARVVVCDGTTREKLPATTALLDVERDAELIAAADPHLDAAPTTKDDIALWKFTTGSTGAPKAAVHAMQNPLVSFHNYGLDVLGMRVDDIVLPVPKLFFGYARDITALYTFGVGAAGIAFPERTTPERLFELIARHRPTIMVNVPTMMAAMVNHPEAAVQDLSCLRLCTSSGEALPEELHRRWIDAFGVEVLEGIGSSEAYHIYISNRPGAARAGSVGQVVPGYDASLDPETGELAISGESIALMYWGDHARSKRTFDGNTIHTGDLFERDDDGYFWYLGRADDLIKVSGIWVAPLEIENCLLQHPAVAECAVASYQESGLLLPRAYVVLRGEATAADLQGFVRERLSPHKYPRDVRFVGELPKTASGKVDKKALVG
jgi:benzoate-CoA ligase family protein